jgi:hypothetical protein
MLFRREYREYRFCSLHSAVSQSHKVKRDHQRACTAIMVTFALPRSVVWTSPIR